MRRPSAESATLVTGEEWPSDQTDSGSESKGRVGGKPESESGGSAVLQDFSVAASHTGRSTLKPSMMAPEIVLPVRRHSRKRPPSMRVGTLPAVRSASSSPHLTNSALHKSAPCQQEPAISTS